MKADNSYSLRNSFVTQSLLKIFLKINILFLFFNCSISYAQKFSFFKYSVENGLPQSTVYDIFQDHNNYLWLATDGGGLVRFDGHYFKTYNKKDGLSGNVVREIVEDKNNQLWIATNNGLQYFNNNKFTNIELLKANVNVYAICLVLRGDKLFVGTTGDGLFEVDVNSKKVTQLNSSNTGLNNNWVIDLTEDNDHNIWIANYIGGLACIKPDGNLIPINSENLNGMLTVSLSNLADGSILCGTQESGFFVFKPNEILKTKKLLSQKMYLKGSSVWHAKYFNRQLYIATQKHGVFLLDEKFNTKINFTTQNGLPSNQFYKIFPDNENNLWLASSGSGIVKFAGFSFLSFDKDQISTSSGVHSIFQKNNSTYWIGCDVGVFELSENKNYNYTITKSKQFNSNTGTVSAFGADNNGNYYIGSKSNGLYILNNKNFVVNYTEKEGLAGNDVSSILHKASDNSIWIGTSAGISLAKDGEILNISESNGLINNEVQKLGLINDHVVAATDGGLVVFSGKSMQSFDEKEGLKEKRLHTFCPDKNGKLFLGTFGDGIYKSDLPVGEIKKFTKLSIPSLDFENIYTLTFCNDTLLAATSDKGLSLISIVNEKVKAVYLFNNQNGFEGIESNLNASLLSSDGKLFIGTVTGLTILNLKDFSMKLIAPKVSIDSIKVNNKTYKTIPEQLSYDQNSIELQAGLIGFSNVSQNRLEYKLEGFDANWNIMASNVFKDNGYIKINYNKLPPGKYTLVLKGICTDGVIPNVSRIVFEVVPPFWTTWWFRIMIGAVLIMGIYLVIQIKEKVLKEKNRILEATVTERTKEIVEKNEELNQQNEEILAQRDEIEHQSLLLSHKNQEITDSINYAQRIQNSLLPDIEELEGELKKVFVIFRPKDIVSGDFYWSQSTKENIDEVQKVADPKTSKLKNSKTKELNIVAADCTGHGVPGAFMSLIGIEKLNDVFEKYNTPSEMLQHLNNAVKNTLKQNSHSNAKDGMDLAFVKIVGNNITYSGANRPLYILKKDANEIIEVKADKVAIGGFTEFNYEFTDHHLEMSPGDRIYIFTDGYADQFGGEKGKKLMTKKLKELIIESSGYSLPLQKEHLDVNFQKWKGNYEQVDDVLLIGYVF